MCLITSGNSEIFTAIIGGLIGGVLGVMGTLFSAYFGPKWLREMDRKELDEKLNGPRKKLLIKLLNDQNYETRTLQTLTTVTGTTDEECRRLLIEIEARGVKMVQGQEGWALISRKPITGE